MKIIIDNKTAEGIHNSLKASLKTTLEKEGFEYKSYFDKSVGQFTLRSYEFDKGFNFNILTGDIASFFELEFKEDQNNYLRFLFVKSGELVHKVSPTIRYRITDNYSCMVAAKGRQKQYFALPIQKDLEILFLQVETKSFSIDLKSDFFQLPSEIENVLKNEKMDSHFIYHSNYTLTISDTINEILNTQKQGVIKRFFIESKALELLWLQAEQYNLETKQGYNPKELRKYDIEILRKAKDYIHENLNQKLTLAIVAQSAGTNETKLKTGFKKLYGKTFTEIVQTERMNKAKALLEEGQLSVKEVAVFCGYQSASMFSAQFKKRFGQTPNKYLQSQ